MSSRLGLDVGDGMGVGGTVVAVGVAVLMGVADGALGVSMTGSEV